MAQRQEFGTEWDYKAADLENKPFIIQFCQIKNITHLWKALQFRGDGWNISERCSVQIFARLLAYPDRDILWFSSVLPHKCWGITYIGSWLFPPKSFPIQHHHPTTWQYTLLILKAPLNNIQKQKVLLWLLRLHESITSILKQYGPRTIH
jgi:hypothetical protein